MPEKGNGDTANSAGATNGAGSGKGKPGGKGKGVGGGQGDGHEGGGNSEGKFEWYQIMLKDRFTVRWDQPLSLEKNLVTTIMIHIDRSGRITSVKMTKSSGNSIMDDSAMTAARRVPQVDPVPKGLGDANGYEVNIDYKLSP